MKIYESHLNFLGKIPVIQQVSGTGRIIYGVCKVIKNYKNQDALSLQEYEMGKSYIAHGLIEIIPIISTLALILFDFLNQYQIYIDINRPDKHFKFNVEVWKIYPSQRVLFDIFENGRFFHIVNQEENAQYSYMHLTKDWGFLRKI
jgi:hypothetical protein